MIRRVPSLSPFFELAAACGNLEHGFPDLPGLDGDTEWGKEPVQQVLPEMSFGCCGADVIRPISDDAQARIAGKVEQRVLALDFDARPHLPGIWRDVARADVVKGAGGRNVDTQPLLDEGSRKRDVNLAV